MVADWLGISRLGVVLTVLAEMRWGASSAWLKRPLRAKKDKDHLIRARNEVDDGIRHDIMARSIKDLS